LRSSVDMKMTTLQIKHSTNLLPVRPTFLLVVALACFTPSQPARAVDPPPDGGYANQNTAEGTDALFSLTGGINNTAMGFDALYGNTTGNANTAIGSAALSNNIDGYQNTATGSFALQFNTSGWNNTATGNQSLLNNATGDDNTANGAFALFRNTGGFKNTANGSVALFDNTMGSNNTAIGFNALGENASGSNNIAVGATAGVNLTAGSNNIYIGNIGGSPGESARIRIGTQGTQTATFIAGISGVAVSGSQVVVNSNGKLGVTASSERFKQEIQPMNKASEAILALQPVTFRYKHDLDPDNIPQFGLIAEDVEKVNPHLVARDEQGKPYSVRYEAVNAMLLNEFLKEHRKVEKLEATLAQQQTSFESKFAQQQKQIDALTAGLQR
jgi:Chaperone of endosialidase